MSASRPCQLSPKSKKVLTGIAVEMRRPGSSTPDLVYPVRSFEAGYIG
jgi:hypothetical protein